MRVEIYNLLTLFGWRTWRENYRTTERDKSKLKEHICFSDASYLKISLDFNSTTYDLCSWNFKKNV